MSKRKNPSTLTFSDMELSPIFGRKYFKIPKLTSHFIDVEQTSQKFTLVAARKDWFKISQYDINIIDRFIGKWSVENLQTTPLLHNNTDDKPQSREYNLVELKGGVLLIECANRCSKDMLTSKEIVYKTAAGVDKTVRFLSRDEFENKILIGIDYADVENNQNSLTLRSVLYRQDCSVDARSWNIVDTCGFQDGYRFFISDQQHQVIEYFKQINNKINIGIKKYNIYHYKDDSFPKHFFNNHIDFNMFYKDEK